MASRPFIRLRAFVLLIAISMGLVAQAVAAMAVPMGQDHVPTLSMSMAGSGHCRDCGGNSSPMTMTPTCAVAPCFVTPAILSLGLVIEPASGAEFTLLAYDMGQG